MSRPVRVHELKTWPVPFRAVLDGSKTFEIRRDDRGFGVGDLLLLREYEPRSEGNYYGRYTLSAVLAKVTYMTPGGSRGLPEDICVMSFSVLGKTASYGNGTFNDLIDAYKSVRGETP